MKFERKRKKTFYGKVAKKGKKLLFKYFGFDT